MFIFLFLKNDREKRTVSEGTGHVGSSHSVLAPGQGMTSSVSWVAALKLVAMSKAGATRRSLRLFCLVSGRGPFRRRHAPRGFREVASPLNTPSLIAQVKKGALFFRQTLLARVRVTRVVLLGLKPASALSLPMTTCRKNAFRTNIACINVTPARSGIVAL